MMIKNTDLELSANQYRDYIHLRNWISRNFIYILLYGETIDIGNYNISITFNSGFDLDILDCSCPNLTYEKLYPKSFILVIA